MSKTTLSKSILHIKVSDAIPSMHGSPNQMFHSAIVELNVPKNVRQVVMTQDPEGRIPCRILDFARITVEYPSGKIQETEINHNDQNDYPLGEQYILSNLVPFETGRHYVRVELWSSFAPPDPNFASTAIYLCMIPEESEVHRVKITDTIPSGSMTHKGSFLNRTVQLIVPNRYSSIVLSTDPMGSKPISIDDWINLTILSPTGKTSKCTIQKNDAYGKPIGEQWIVSNVVKMEPGLNTIKAELWNEFVPQYSNNYGSTSIWMVVKE